MLKPNESSDFARFSCIFGQKPVGFYDSKGFKKQSLRALYSIRIKLVVPPLNGTQGKSKINCVREGVQDGTDKKEL